MCHQVKFLLPQSIIYVHPRSLTARPWKPWWLEDGSFPFGFRELFRGEPFHWMVGNTSLFIPPEVFTSELLMTVPLAASGNVPWTVNAWKMNAEACRNPKSSSHWIRGKMSKNLGLLGVHFVSLNIESILHLEVCHKYLLAAFLVLSNVPLINFDKQIWLEKISWE